MVITFGKEVLLRFSKVLQWRRQYGLVCAKDAQVGSGRSPLSPVLQHPQVLLQSLLLLPELVILGKELLYSLCISVWQIAGVGCWSWCPVWQLPVGPACLALVLP